MTTFNIPLPGSPTLHPTYTAEATPSGALDVQLDPSTPNLVTPLKTFSYALPGGTKTFYKNMPVVVSPALKAELLAAGLVS